MSLPNPDNIALLCTALTNTQVCSSVEICGKSQKILLLETTS